MPRKVRSIYAGEYYHIVSRGNDRQKLFRANEDYVFYLDQIGSYQKKYNVELVHYCLMTNHVHLLMCSRQDKKGITKLMHGVQMVYARYFKKKYKKTGHLFEGRFKSFHIQTESYLLECGRYIERNPLRAEMVEELKAYPWSSYRKYGYGEENVLITENILYAGLGKNEHERQDKYREYVEPARAYEEIVTQYFEKQTI